MTPETESRQDRRAALLRRHGYETTPERVFLQLEQGFGRAYAAQPTAELKIALGPLVVRFRLAGEGLFGVMLLAFGHLKLAPETPYDAAIDLYDSAATPGTDVIPGLPCAPSPWGLVVGDTDHRHFHDWRPGCDAALSLTQARIVGRWTDSRSLTHDELAKPLHRLLGGLLSARTTAMVHAALIGDGSRGVLMAGIGGSGKSTSALACWHAGMEFFGDDYVGARLEGEAVAGYSLFGNGLAEPAALARAGIVFDPSMVQAGPETEKHLFRLGVSDRPSRVRTAITAIVLPRVGPGGRTLVEPATGTEFLLAAGVQSTFVNVQNRRIALDVLAGIATRLPVWRLTLGTNLREVVETIREILRSSA